MSDALERNVDALVRAAALRLRQREAKARFLGALEGTSKPWPLAAAAAVLLVATLASVFRHLDPPRVSPARDVRPTSQEAAAIPVKALAEDATLALRARIKAGRKPFLRLDGSADLPDRFVLFLTAGLEREGYDGRRLRPRESLVYGGHARVRGGRFFLEFPWTVSGPLRVAARLSESDQSPDARAAMKEAYPAREWRFVAAAWDDRLMEALGPALDELGAEVAALVALLKDAEAAARSEARWKEDAPRLIPAAEALLERARLLSAGSPFSAAAELLHRTARDLAGSCRYLSWKDGVFEGPLSYHADRQKLKTFREEAWTFAALRRYAEEARDVAARELALWIVKDRRRGGLRPPHAELAVRPELAAWAERLRAETDLDALEAEIRR